MDLDAAFLPEVADPRECAAEAEAHRLVAGKDDARCQEEERLAEIHGLARPFHRDLQGVVLPFRREAHPDLPRFAVIPLARSGELAGVVAVPHEEASGAAARSGDHEIDLGGIEADLGPGQHEHGERGGVLLEEFERAPFDGVGGRRDFLPG